MATPYVTIVRNVVSSTQDLARAELAGGDNAVLAIAHEQTAGRGRIDNEWWQADRAIAASLAIRESSIVVDGTFPLAVGLAVRRSIAAAAARDTTLKWPNDILRGEEKVGGVLVERKDGLVIVGCGLNLYWAEPPRGAGALLDSDPGPELGPMICSMWADQVVAPGFGWDREAYLGACSTLGSRVTWLPDGSGVAKTVAVDGGLVVQTGQGEVTLRSGEVRMIRTVSGGA